MTLPEAGRPFSDPDARGGKWLTPPLSDARDACGVGVVADIKGRPSHRIISDALEVLENLEHRGARNSDPETGDGAGILFQMPDKFFREECREIGIELPPSGEYGVGCVFLSQDPDLRRECEEIIEQIVGLYRQRFLGWRDVPVDHRHIGRFARETEPVIRQFFTARRSAFTDEPSEERDLYLIRRVIKWLVEETDSDADGAFYISSLSSNRVVYKGMLLASQLPDFYPDLRDPRMSSVFAMVHSRFGTNTLAAWQLAHPHRFVVHNGEINTLRGNVNGMVARQGMMSSPFFGDDMDMLFPVANEGVSDTVAFDNTLELLLATGRSLPHALTMMIPEAWERNERMSREKRDYYEYQSCLMEPWDGPALIVATDGHKLAAILDRNGLRPFRYTITSDDLLVMGSETGVLPIPPEKIVRKGRLSPGRMFLLDPEQGRIVDDGEIKADLASRQPYGQWLAENKVELQSLPPPDSIPPSDPSTLLERQQAFGYTSEDLSWLIQPMAENGEEPVGSMGNDTPPAVLSDNAPNLFSYFKQLFAQVSNPPLDAIREELVTSMDTFVGCQQNLFEETPLHCRQLRLSQPLLTSAELAQIRDLDRPGFRTIMLPALFDASSGEGGMQAALDSLLESASRAVEDGYTILILSDREVSVDRVPIPSLLATAAVHHHLIREGSRTKAGIVVESGEPREVHHFALLLGYGASAVNPYLAHETIEDLATSGLLDHDPPEAAISRFQKAAVKGVRKVMSKMGISTLQSYRGAQIFEALGLNGDLIDRYFTWTPSRIEGADMARLEREARTRHASGYSSRKVAANGELAMGGDYQWLRFGEYHMYNPDTIAKLQYAAKYNDVEAYREFASLIDAHERSVAAIRALLDFKKAPEPLPMDQVEPAREIVKRFATGAISLGSISREAHESLAIAMNRIGGRSNTGEGGEDYRRYKPDQNGDSRNSAIKQVASGRFGVTADYLSSATDLQIKMAQGSKPGEGGQIPGFKVDDYIAWVRHTTPGVELISPPPHHDIYSIEDLAQLIHDLKNANPSARIHVKLVAEAGVGTIAAGVSKGHADVVLISGDSGGTGASPLSSIKHAGLPWELGVAETQKVLVENDLRGRIVIQTDGQLKTGRDVAVACLLGAEEFGFATAPLVVMGCVMLRNCHLNTCSVGIATQDPELRKRFAGSPQALIDYFFLVAEHLREIMSEIGVRTIDEMVGRTDFLKIRGVGTGDNHDSLNLSHLLEPPNGRAGAAIHHCTEQDHRLEYALDHHLIALARPALDEALPVSIEHELKNSNRAVCTMLSAEITRRFGGEGLPESTIKCRFTGSAGQSFGAFMASGIDVAIEGDANDYLAKGMSGGTITLVPPASARFVPEENVIAGNVVLYGATSGRVFMRGRAGERFAVRNSGAAAVVEGVADHGCEYMTGGVVVVIGPTGRNFAAGMSGGTAFVLDEDAKLERLCNHEMVDLEPVEQEHDIETLKSLLDEHFRLTGSSVAERLLEAWPESLSSFVKVMPRDYKRLARERSARREQAAAAAGS